MKHNKNDNLKPFRKGFDERRQQGRKKGSINRKTAVKRLLEAPVSLELALDQTARTYCSELKDKTFLEVLNIALLNRSLAGDTRVATLLLNILADAEEGEPKPDMRWEIEIVPNRKDMDIE